VYATPFDPRQGWQDYEQGNFRALVIRMENLSEWSAAFTALTGQAAPGLLHEHKTKHPDYARFARKAVLPDRYYERLRQSHLRRHFYPS
jgi:hypothetical protein